MNDLWMIGLFLVIGVVTGMSSSMLGFGGGFLVVPTLFWSFRLMGLPEAIIMPLAVGTSLAIMVVTVSNSAYRHYRKGSMHWPLCLRLMPGVIVGSLLAVELMPYLGENVLRYTFSFVLLCTLVYSFFKKSHAHIDSSEETLVPSWPLFLSFGGLTGLLATSLGIGGSMLTVPFFRRLKMPMARASGMAAILALPVAIVGALGHVFAKHYVPGFPAHAVGYVYVPALIGAALGVLVGVPIGVRLVYRIPDGVLAKAYFVIVSAVFIAMIV